MSHALNRLMEQATKEDKVTYSSLVDCLGGQGFGLIIVLFALPSALPISAIPGFSFIFGLPIVFAALQLIIGRRNIWLPQFLASREVNKERLVQIITKTLPVLRYIEKLLKPRLCFMTSPIMERVHGVMLLLLSLLLLLPIPMSNFIFAAIIILFGLGLSSNDGLCVIIAYLAMILYGFFIYGVIVALF